MFILQKIQFFGVQMSLAHLLLCEVQTLTINPNLNYENKAHLCIVPDSEQSIYKVSSFVSQVHLQPRQKNVIRYILSCIMDQCVNHAVLLQRGIEVLEKNR